MIKNMYILIGLVMLSQPHASAVKFEVSDDEYDQQQHKYPSSFEFYDAFQEALENFISDEGNEHSLLYIIKHVYADKERAHEYLNNLINNTSTVLRLQSLEDGPAPHKECLCRNWIFRLTIPEIGRTFWAIVDRYDEVPAYNYQSN